MGNAHAKSNSAVMARRETASGERGQPGGRGGREAIHLIALALAHVSISRMFCKYCLDGTNPF